MPPNKRGTGAALSTTRRLTSLAPTALRPKTNSTNPTSSAAGGTANNNKWESGGGGVSRQNSAARGAESARCTIPGVTPCPAKGLWDLADICALGGAWRAGGAAGGAREGGERRARSGGDRGGGVYGAVKKAVMVDGVADSIFTEWGAALFWAALWAAATSFVRARAPMNTAGGTEETVTRTTSASALSTAGRVLRGAGSGCSRHRRGPSQRCVGDHRLLGTGARLAVFAFAFAFALVPATSAPVLNADITTAVAREFFRVTN